MSRSRGDLLQGLSEQQAAEVNALGRTIQVPANGTLFRIGDSASQVFRLVRGRVVLKLPIQVRGKEEEIVVEERLAGETLGWSGLIAPHVFTLTASAPVESELVAFSREALLEHFRAHPEVAFTVTRNVAEVIGNRLEVFRTMWLREMQRVVELRYS